MAVRQLRSIGVIGTPGCGKTTLCQNLGMPVLSLRDIAKENQCLGDVEADGAAPVDVERLAELWQHPDVLTLIDGHLAHHVPVDALVVVRCHPNELRKRLMQRGYSAEKVQANVEVEMMGGPWNELIGDSRSSFEGEGVREWIESGCPPHTTPDSAIDWLSQP